MCLTTRAYHEGESSCVHDDLEELRCRHNNRIFARHRATRWGYPCRRRRDAIPRRCLGTSSATGPAVAADGRQWSNGTVDAAISIYEGDGTQLDAALVAAA